MSPEILMRKLMQINRYLADLHNLSIIDFNDYMKNHYAIERLVELLVISAVVVEAF